MEYRILHDKNEIEQALRFNEELNIYALGDLDPFFWPRTLWFGEKDYEKNWLLFYTGMAPGTLIALTDEEPERKAGLLKTLLPFLPRWFNTHISPGILEHIPELVIIKDHKKEYRMILKKSLPPEERDPGIRFLRPENLEEIMELYDTAYPENWFDKRMLETGKYVGFFDRNKPVAIAGIHVYSRSYKTAALGNITTHPAYRGKGIASGLVRFLCRDLLNSVEIIGLNVKAHNKKAIRLYEKCGFEITSEMDELLLENCWHPGELRV